MALTGASNEEKIWNYLKGKFGNAYGAAAMMGNLYAESGLRPDNLENLCEKRLKEAGKSYCTDALYTAAVDNGTISAEEFLHPLPGKQYGYGLAQWTSPGRKSGLWSLVKSRGVSIADLEAQLDYLMQELQKSYVSVLNALKTASTVRGASDIVLKKFEAPADCSAAVCTRRAGYGQTYYDKYAKTTNTATAEKGGSKVTDYSKYINSTGTHYISNSGSDENGSYAGGKAGDQTGKEWYLRSWYNRPWNCVLRHPDANVRQKLAELACAAALNDKIGYDQNQRTTYWTQLKAAGYDPSKIATACEADCSAGVIANVRAVGYLLGLTALQNVNATYTGNMRSGLKAAGFEVLTASKYLTGAQYLLPGDILLNDAHHTAMNVTKGSKASTSTTASTTTATTTGGSYMFSVGTVQKGCTGNDVKLLQRLLKSNGCKGSDGKALTIDGEAGANTDYAIRTYQKKKGLAVDGCAGQNTWKSILLR